MTPSFQRYVVRVGRRVLVEDLPRKQVRGILVGGGGGWATLSRSR